MSTPPIIGIDLGTTNSVVALLENGQPRVVPNSEGSNKTPSVVAFTADGQAVVGELARRQAATNPGRTILSVKRLMGRYFSDLANEADNHRLGLRTDESDRVLIDIDGVGYTPQQISALILDKLKKSVEDYTGEAVTEAIITVPAYFDDLQRTATIEAAEMAGLKVLRLINEPTAAAMAYGLGQEKDEVIAVYDFGGGTFDISILELDENTLEVLNCAGDTHLGGDDFDRILAQHLTDDFQQKNGFALELDAIGHRRLLEAAEKAKCDLSTLREVTVNLPFIGSREGQPFHLETVIRRKEFEDLIEETVQRTLAICAQALREARREPSDIKKVILVGGTTRIPLVQELVEEFFGLQPFKGVNPDEIVALGAATQAGVLSGELQEVLLLDVTPHSLGVEVREGGYSVIIEKNSTVPIKAAKTFTTTEENQTFVNIHILQGEHSNADENRSLGKFTLSDIPPAPAGQARIRVTFFINTDGIVEISANDIISGTQQSLTIAHSFLDVAERERRNRRRSSRIRRSRGRGAEGAILKGEKLEKETGFQDETPHPKHNFDLVLNETFEDEGGKPNSSAMVAIGGDTRPLPARTTLGEKDTQRIHKPQILTSIKTEWPDEMNQIRPLLEQPIIDEGQKEKLLRVLPLFQAHLKRHPADHEARLTFARICLLCNLAEECRESLFALGAAETRYRVGASQMFIDLVRQFPNYAHARRDKADLALQMNQPADAIEDLEFLLEQDPAHTEVVKKLSEAYRTELEGIEQATARFRLVKIYLRLQKLDESIELLRQLIKKPDYRDKALRVLGLCYWQKNMHLLAWQTLRELPLDDDLKDILYRLAGDMEMNDQLASAREIFSHIASEGSPFRDASARMRKADFRLRLRHEEMQQTQAVSEDRVELADSRFALVQEINRGSMGIVFKARDKILDEVVALKILNDMLAADPLSVERFKQEARAAKRLSHPNIVRIHDFFESGSKKYLSMEFIDGQDVKKILSEKKHLPEDQVTAMMIEVLRALDYAHRLGVVHRDIKPANIMLATNQEVKVTDFGIAKILSSNDMTRANAMIVGTPLYMSPEQIEGGNIDARSDIYSLGITCYELLAGEPPFHDGNIEYHHIHTVPPELPERISAGMRQFVGRCIEKDRSKRFQTSQEAIDFLKAND